MKRSSIRQPLQERIWSKVYVGSPTECWPWLWARKEKGYGVIGWKGKSQRAHRIVWEISNGMKIPDGGCICHTCDNPPCCNPAHLYLGNRKTNGEDASRRKRTKNASSWYRGSLINTAKLTESKVLEACKRWDAGEFKNLRHMANEYGISVSQAFNIAHKYQWKHLFVKTEPTRI